MTAQFTEEEILHLKNLIAASLVLLEIWMKVASDASTSTIADIQRAIAWGRDCFMLHEHKNPDHLH